MNTSYSSLTTRVLRLALPALLPLASCETVVDLPEPPHTPRIALQYTLSNTPPSQSSGTNVYTDLFISRRLFVSNSQRIFDTKYLEGRDDATVEIRDDKGAVVEKFRAGAPTGGQYYGAGFYEPTLGLLGEAGKTYTLRASLPGFESVESTLTLPAKPVIENATFVPRYPNGGSGLAPLTGGRLNVTVADDAATTDYYLAFARVLDRQGNPGNWSPVRIDYVNQGSDLQVGQFQLSDLTSYGYGGNDVFPYPDTNVNGQRFALTADVAFYSQSYCGPGQICPDPSYMEVFVSKLTADTYNFYQSRRRYQDADGNPFAEPAPLSSNIKPGYGLFGGATDATYRIKLF